jgi:hypothetical protein
VINAPVPGIATMISEVSRNAKLTPLTLPDALVAVTLEEDLDHPAA